MRIGVLGTGGVGQTLATKLVEIGHDVRMGAREAGNERAGAWVAETGERSSEGSFADAAGFGELVVNATAGAAALDALNAAGADNLAGKVLIDVSNPLDFSRGMPPTLTVCNDDSVGEQIQRAFPDTRVVKALNTVTASLMVDPGQLPRPHHLFVCGNDDAAKSTVRDLLTELGWQADEVLDVGDISAARGTEMYLPLWLRIMGAVGGPVFSVRVVAAE
jgi:8-hydroxy-5-deazaflavin:NADPH oxidoreductase